MCSVQAIMAEHGRDGEVVEVGGSKDNPERYHRYKKCLGKGAFKTVYEAFDTEHANLVAWNQVDRGNLSGDKYDEFLREVLVLKDLDHRNIIKMSDWWESEDKSHVVEKWRGVMERCGAPGGCQVCKVPWPGNDASLPLRPAPHPSAGA